MQLVVIQIWDRFDGRWLRGEEFIYPAQPKDGRIYGSRHRKETGGEVAALCNSPAALHHFAL
jgi:hypothetical protein